MEQLMFFCEKPSEAEAKRAISGMFGVMDNADSRPLRLGIR